MITRKKDPQKQAQGRLNRARGQQFEDRLATAFDYYRERGSASIEKTPEPMKVLKSLGHGRFVACFIKKAQPDYKGLLRGGREILFEAKFTATDRMDWERVKQEQRDYLEEHQGLGARCYVVVGFLTGGVYRLPWDDWKNMKQRFGRKYVTEADLKPYTVPVDRGGRLLLIG